MKRSSSTAERLLEQLFGSPAVDALVSDQQLLQAMLDVEAALAESEADAGLVPAAAAAEIAAACDVALFDAVDIARRSVAAGNPAAPLVRDLIDAVSADAQAYVHLGATSQDIIDTALSLISHRALAVILDELATIGDACAALSEEHGATVMTARTLLQQALPTTFGLKAAAWLVAVDEARALLSHVRSERLAIQLGGAAGTLAALQHDGVDVASRLAERLGLAEPVMPWHTDRTRPAELAAALAMTVGVLGKMARDVTLLAQPEIAEVSEGEGGDHGTSSTLPQKRNAMRAVLIVAAAERAPGLAGTVLHAMVQEHERAAGAWHAEWETIRELLHLVGGASHHAVQMLASLRVDASRMAENLTSGGGIVMAESVAHRLTSAAGQAVARDIVRRCVEESRERHASFAEVVAGDAEVRRHLSEPDIAAALDPSGYLGSAQALIRRARLAHREIG